MKFEDHLEVALQNIVEGHPYLRSTSHSAEKRINRANVRANEVSGLPNYPHRNRERQKLLKDIESKRPLRRSEYIYLYGYEAWLEYTKKYGLPETHKWADAPE